TATSFSRKKDSAGHRRASPIGGGRASARVARTKACRGETGLNATFPLKVYTLRDLHCGTCFPSLSTLFAHRITDPLEIILYIQEFAAGSGQTRFNRLT